jgi:hypothetical protein
LLGTCVWRLAVEVGRNAVHTGLYKSQTVVGLLLYSSYSFCANLPDKAFKVFEGLLHVFFKLECNALKKS